MRKNLFIIRSIVLFGMINFKTFVKNAVTKPGTEGH